MKNKIRSIIVDDQRLARKDLASLLTEFDYIEIVGEADSVTSAIQLINEKSPDLIFLDIQMPGETGFDLLEKADLKARVIFVTAYDEYAIRAFEVDAIDYLLKPVNPDRLRQSLDRLEHGGQPPPEPKHALNENDSIFLWVNNHPKFLKVKSIISIQAAKDYSEIITVDGKKGLVEKSMTEWERRLPENMFCRIHRSTIINLEYILRIEEMSPNSLQVHLKGIATPLDISRRYAAKITKKFG